VRKEANDVTHSFEQYVKTVNLELLFKKLGSANPGTLAKTVRHFTLKEAEKRDEIVLGYFGEAGVKRIVEAIAKRLQTPKLRKGSKVLDVGAGSGFFTAKIAERIPDAEFYAMDATPAMLKALARKKLGITPFLGIAENIEASITEANAYAEIPAKFDAAFSTLMLHHSIEPENVFKSIKKVLTKNGKAVILDLCEHNFTEFKTEMEDVHLGFKLGYIRKTGKLYFSNVEIAKMPGIGCSCSGRKAEIFVATMHNNA
jgi:ubiquinone/menaquinone biosynthesis C-methylase UbiE